MKTTTLVILIIGALNWGVLGLFGYNLIAGIFGVNLMLVSRIIFILVGIAGLYAITFFWDRKPISVPS